jgi:tetratricopeptide (TPR) repeat protein
MADSPRLEELKRRVQRDPASISFAALAEEYRRLGMIAEAIDTCRAGLQRHPAYLSARVTLGRALVEMGEFDEATVELEQVLRSAPENLAAIRALADIHRRRGEMPERFDHLEPPAAEARIPVSAATARLPLSAAAGTAASAPPATAVHSAAVAVAPEPPAPVELVELEAFLLAIERVKRAAAPLAVR